MAKSAFYYGDIEQKCTQWGLWARGDGLGAAALRKGNGVQPDITDDEAALFERLVLRMRLANDRYFHVVRGSYCREASMREMAEELKCSVGSVRQWHQQALQYLQGALDGVVVAEEERRGAQGSGWVAGVLGLGC